MCVAGTHVCARIFLHDFSLFLHIVHGAANHLGVEHYFSATFVTFVAQKT